MFHTDSVQPFKTCLVGGLEHLIFPYIVNVIIPSDSYFSEGQVYHQPDILGSTTYQLVIRIPLPNPLRVDVFSETIRGYHQQTKTWYIDNDMVHTWIIRGYHYLCTINKKDACKIHQKNGTRWCPSSLAKLVQITPISLGLMVDISYS